MKVRIAGFQLTYHQHLNVDTLTSALLAKHGKRIAWPPHRRVLRVAKDGDFVLGSLLTDRGHKAFLAIDTESNALSRGRLAKNKNFAAFSFFVLCRRKPAAIITTYRDAGGASFVFGVLEKIGDEALEAMRTKAIATGGAGLSPRQKKQIAAEYKPPSLRWAEYLGRAQYEAVLRRWNRVKAVELAYAKEKAPAAFLPFDGDDVESTQLRVAFKRKTPVSRAVDCVRQLWDKVARKADQAEDGIIRVDGLDEFGLSRRVEIQEHIPSLMGELDHDGVIADPTSFDDDLRRSGLIRHLRHLIDHHPALFG